MLVFKGQKLSSASREERNPVIYISLLFYTSELGGSFCAPPPFEQDHGRAPDPAEKILR